MEDTYSFNSGYDVLSIGRIEAMHIYRGKGMVVGEDARGRITYHVSGFSLIPNEDKLELWKGGYNN